MEKNLYPSKPQARRDARIKMRQLLADHNRGIKDREYPADAARYEDAPWAVHDLVSRWVAGVPKEDSWGGHTIRCSAELHVDGSFMIGGTVLWGAGWMVEGLSQVDLFAVGWRPDTGWWITGVSSPVYDAVKALIIAVGDHADGIVALEAATDWANLSEWDDDPVKHYRFRW